MYVTNYALMVGHSTSRAIQVVRITVRPARVLIFCMIFNIDHFKTRTGQKIQISAKIHIIH